MEPGATSAEALRRAQLQSLNELLRALPANAFYAKKVGEKASEFRSLEDYSANFPLTTKPEIAQDQSDQPPYGRNLTYPLERYSRLHQTSGTTGKPLRWLDTPETWDMLVDCWTDVYRAAGVTRKDSVYFAFSFGPFLGFWLAFDAANHLGCLCIPGGGQTSVARLNSIIDLRATVLCCTPSYAIHLAEVAAREPIDLAKGHVRLIMVAGEAGGSIPATRAQIERLWPGARVSDHHGMTEVGAVSYECPAQPCRLHVIDWAYFAEVIDPETLRPVSIGTPGELVLTTLKRVGSPLLRYRTGDLVKLAPHHGQGQPCACGTFNTTLEGGILGRTDDMVVVRGVNIYPSAVEQIVRQFAEVAEYQAHITRRGALTEMHLAIEPVADLIDGAALPARVEKVLQAALNLRIPVTLSPPGSLPRAEFKARRWIKDEPHP
jgi:phenylacetate-CoA ligase